MYKHITDNTPTVVESGLVRHAVITVNAALTGTVTIYDAVGSATSPTVAVITNPALASRFDYFNLANGFKVVASGTCDITAQTDNLIAS